MAEERISLLRRARIRCDSGVSTVVTSESSAKLPARLRRVLCGDSATVGWLLPRPLRGWLLAAPRRRGVAAGTELGAGWSPTLTPASSSGIMNVPYASDSGDR